MMQRACKLEISGSLPVCIPRRLVLTNNAEYKYSTRGGRGEGAVIQKGIGLHKMSLPRLIKQ